MQGTNILDRVAQAIRNHELGTSKAVPWPEIPPWVRTMYRKRAAAAIRIYQEYLREHASRN